MRKTAQPAVVSIEGGFLMVRYPYRKTPDLYIIVPAVSGQGHTIKCCNCDAPGFDFEDTIEFLAHVAKHDKRRRP